MKKKFLMLILMIGLLSGCATDVLSGDNGSSASSYKDTNAYVEASATVPADSHFKITYLDVGQADAALVECDSHYMLIDGGNVADSSLIVSYLTSQGVTYLDYVINSHSDEDHCGGLAGALVKFTAGCVMSSATSCDTEAFSNFVKYTEAQGLSITVPSPGETFDLGSSTITILGPLEDYGNANDNSIVLRIVYGSTSFLFTGDISREVEDELVDAGVIEESTVLKVAHHGSEYSTGYVWLRAVMPEYAIISVGANNSYGHPSEDTLSRLRDAEATVYRTDQEGNITVTSDGSTVSIYTEESGAVESSSTPSVAGTSPSPTAEPTIATSTDPGQSSSKYEVTITCTRIEYSHLGEDISISNTYDGAEIQSGDTITISEGAAIFTTTITENDSVPDIGSNSVTFDITSITRSTSQSFTVRVDENGGTRYPDAYAVWQVTYTLTPVG